MAKLFKRPTSDKWQVECWIWAGDRRQRILKSTGIRDDGGAKSRQNAQIVADQIERRLALGGEASTRPRKTLKQALTALTEAAELAGRTQHSLDRILYRGVRLAEGLREDTALADIDADRLRDYARWSRQRRSANTVQQELVVLAAAFEICGLERPEMPDIGDTSAKPQRVLELDEQRALLLAVPAKRKLNVMGYLQMGLRRSEPWKIVEIDWQDRYAFVQRTKRKKDAKAPSIVPIPDELFELLLPRRGEWPVFPEWCRGSVNQVLQRAAERAKICDDLSVNDLRGTYATHMARGGVPILTLANIMGTSVKMLENIYAQVNSRGDHLHEAAGRVPRLSASPVHQIPRPRGQMQQP